MTRHSILMILAICAGCGDFAHTESTDPRELIREARALAELSGERIWAGFADAPFGVLLVEEDKERLFCHRGPAAGFESLGIDPILSCASSSRQPSFPPNMLASLPAVDGIPTIVIGTPQATDKSPDGWVLTVLHEHFHQVQFSWPDYYPGIGSLGLSKGDETGMWMLEYPFPYERAETASAFRVMADRLLETLNARGADTFHDAVAQYWQARESARQTVSEDDWRYIEVQLWQEGVARWTEGAVAALSDRYAAAAGEANKRIMRELAELDLAQQRRSAVYPIGAGEAMLLEAVGPEWRARYWTEPFSLGPQLAKLVDDNMRDSAREGLQEISRSD